jgi:hypothetical protein
MRQSLRAQLLVLAIAVVPNASRAQVNVTTWHNDNARTGQNLNETTLTRNLVGSVNTFGKLCSTTVDGPVHAQPLVASVTIGGVGHTAVFVATENNTLYVFDGIHYTPGQPCIQLAKRHLAPAGSSLLNGGILGTPVIDTATNTLYLVAAYQSGAVGAHYIHAIDIASPTLSDKATPVQVSGGTFLSLNQVQRPGLLGLSGTSGGAFSTVYVGFARTDHASANHRGWVFNYDAASLAQKTFYCVTCGTTAANGGGIWQGAGGLAAGVDSSGKTYLFFATGDGTFDLNTGGQNAGDSFLKMSPELSGVVDYFTPADQACRICSQRGVEHDKDFGSGGVTLIPDGLLTNYPYLAVLADKEGYIWVMDRSNPGKFNGSSTGTCPNRVCTGPNANVETVRASTHEFHNNPAYWNGNLYYAPLNDTLKLYPLANSTCATGTPPVCSAHASTTTIFQYGATPSVSSNGTSDGIVWAINTTGRSITTIPGVLLAFSTDTLAQLYSSSKCTIGGVPQDQPGGGTSFSVPTIANGRVYMGSEGGSTGGQGGFHMYGPLTRTCDGTVSQLQAPTIAEPLARGWGGPARSGWRMRPSLRPML